MGDGCTDVGFPDCGCHYTIDDDGIHFCEFHKNASEEIKLLTSRLGAIGKELEQERICKASIADRGGWVKRADRFEKKAVLLERSIRSFLKEIENQIEWQNVNLRSGLVKAEERWEDMPGVDFSILEKAISSRWDK